MTYEDLRLEVDGDGVATITLHRPEMLNAFGRRLETELQDVTAALEADASVLVVVLTGAGRAFCAGGDLGEMEAPGGWGASVEEREARFLALHEVPRRLHRMPKPTIAMVNGVAAGAGCSLALACDIRVASETAKLGPAYVKVGLTDDSGGGWFLPRLVGPAKALEICLSGAIVNAEEALRIGMVNRMVAAESLAEETYGLARELARAPRGVVASIKGMVQGVEGQSLEEYLRESAVVVARELDDPEHRSLVGCFLSKSSG